MWHEKSIGNTENAFGNANRIQQAFLARYVASGQIGRAAIFIKYCTEIDTVTAYFSPDAFALAYEEGATPCHPPPNKGLTLLVGKRMAGSHCF